MAGRRRVLGFLRALSRPRWGRFPLWLGLCAAGACLNIDTQTGVVGSPNGQPTTGVPVISMSSSAGAAGDCAPTNSENPVFAQQGFDQDLLFARDFYTWTSDEQALALRRDELLFSQPASSSEPFAVLGKLAAGLEIDQLAGSLRSTFSSGRYAWPEPWPTRLGFSGQDPGGQLVHITLKPEAWLAVVTVGSVYVYDDERHLVATSTAFAHLARIGAIYFDSTRGAPVGCGDSSGYRGFLLGNLAMVQEWSLGTQQIADRIQSNIDQLTQFFNLTRACPVTADFSSWSQSVLCFWSDQQGGDGIFDVIPSTEVTLGAGGEGGIGGIGGIGFAGSAEAGSGEAAAGGVAGSTSASGGADASGVDAGSTSIPGLGSSGQAGGGSASNGSEILAYEQALAIPSADYLPAPAQIAAIIGTLQGDLFQPDPLVVTPGSP